MDDRELEARVRAHLHERFDGRPVPAGLEGSVAGLMRPVAATRVGFRLASTTLRLGWATVAVALVVAAALLVRNGLGPASPGPSSTLPVATPATERQFIVLSPNVRAADKASASVVSDLLAARLRALGYENFTAATGNAFLFTVPAAGPSDGATRRTLGTNGVVAFVPLPASDYGEGKREARVGVPLPVDEPALFGWEGIASAQLGKSPQQLVTIDVTLTPAARTAFGAYTSAHVGESFAIVIDDIVRLVSTINEPTSGGELQITGPGPAAPGTPDDGFAEVAAILVGGPLPLEWFGLFSPITVDLGTATSAALELYPGATVEDAQLDARAVRGAWEPVWNIQVGGNLQHGCPMLPPGATTCPPPGGSLTVVVDGNTGQVVEVLLTGQ